MIQKLNAQKIDIHTHDGVADSWIFQPEGIGNWPGVILLPDIKGTRPVFHQMAQHLASLGHVVLVPNIYYRTAPAEGIDQSVSFGDAAGKAYLLSLRATLTTPNLHTDHAAYIETLSRHASVKDKKLAVVGYCMSGAFALRAAADFPDHIVAAASFHGGGLASQATDSPHLRAEQIKATLYLGYATDDASMPAESIVLLEDSLRKAGVSFNSDLYAANHGFAVSDNPSYDQTAADLHWRMLGTLLKEALG